MQIITEWIGFKKYYATKIYDSDWIIVNTIETELGLYNTKPKNSDCVIVINFIKFHKFIFIKWIHTHKVSLLLILYIL